MKMFNAVSSSHSFYPGTSVVMKNVILQKIIFAIYCVSQVGALFFTVICKMVLLLSFSLHSYGSILYDNLYSISVNPFKNIFQLPAVFFCNRFVVVTRDKCCTLCYDFIITMKMSIEYSFVIPRLV